MHDFRRSVFRILLLTCFLLIIAWVSLKLMQYRGDWERLIRDLQDTQIVRFAREKILPIFQEKIVPFIQEKMAPIMERAVESIKNLLPADGN